MEVEVDLRRRQRSSRAPTPQPAQPSRRPARALTGTASASQAGQLRRAAASWPLATVTRLRR